MNRTLANIWIAGLILTNCQGSSDQFNTRKGGVGKGALEAKKFGDDDFRCASLTTLPKDGWDGGETPDQLDSEEEGEPVTIKEWPLSMALLAESVTYNGQIKALLAAKCVSCHKPGGTPPDVSTYKAAKAAGEDSLRTIKDGSMPTSKPLPEADQATFEAWVTGDFPEGTSASSGGSKPESNKKPASSSNGNGGGDSDMCQPPEGATAGSGDAEKKPSSSQKPSGGAKDAKPTFVGGVKALLDSKCNSCHKPGGTPPDLTTYALAKEEGPASLATIEDGSMPPSKPLADDQKALFKKWAEADYPEK